MTSAKYRERLAMPDAALFGIADAIGGLADDGVGTKTKWRLRRIADLLQVARSLLRETEQLCEGQEFTP